MRFNFQALIIASLMAGCSCAHAASFDCGKARSPIEKLICADSKLSSMDEQLNVAFKDAVSRSGAKPVLVAWQRRWLKSFELTQCKDAKCLQVEFSKRTSLLQSVAPSTDPSAQWNGDFSRYYKGKPDKDSANLLLIGLTGKKVFVEGDALWLGPNAVNGQVNTGEILGIGNLKSDKAVFNLDGCSATMVMKNLGIEVEEETGCGGMNVTFVGDYKRR
jgi:uncharacterized protein